MYEVAYHDPNLRDPTVRYNSDFPEGRTMLTQRVQYRRPDSTRSASVRSACVRLEDLLRYDMIMRRCSLRTVTKP